jgi:hypothetical protein
MMYALIVGVPVLLILLVPTWRRASRSWLVATVVGIVWFAVWVLVRPTI